MELALTRADRPHHPEWRLLLLDTCAALRDGYATALPAGCIRLVAFVALGVRSPTRQEARRALWGSLSPKGSDACLRSAIWRLGRQAPGLLTCRGDRLAIVGEAQVDVHELLADLRAALVGPEATGPPRVDLTRHRTLLPGWGEPWVVRRRLRLDQLWLHGIEAHADALARIGQLGAAAACVEAALRHDPLRESSAARLATWRPALLGPSIGR